ncbi:L-seryl-tRNA(Sec) selenium transferase [Paenibacillus sp. cl141a]|uniref:L-seryl-tRNA(Sec) selenium transferase n=1 Tax=Paenibacillus sp. cl141a TaxID=1761877 RepID=UPI0008D00807|nr:L-seryl-tRNA(Sec) selenium transferase [Paenibacillus sp. cl141a]SEK32998.1 L-seryl-tRNA(Sec) selenium transferase [Paenibacillus sp. cl141a]
MILRSIPSVASILNNPIIKNIAKNHAVSSDYITILIKKYLEEVRSDIVSGQLTSISEDQLLNDFVDYIWKRLKPKMVPVVNATGVVLHTNLGRSVLPNEVNQHLTKIAGRYSNLEYNLETGKRGSRHDIVEQIITTLTGAEAALVVNNNASAVFLILKAIASGKEVVVSRGEIVEIGGSFRISDIMKESGAVLNEVGTTNRTYTYDYERAINENTAMLLKVHKSNFVMNGYTHSVMTEDLVMLGQKHHIPVYEDLGSGVLYDLKKHNIGNEPFIKEIVDKKVDLISFSGDKLLGGPQAGIIIGRRDLINTLKKNPLIRALRPDKLTLAALESTLLLYLDEKKLVEELPTLRDILLTPQEIKKKAEELRDLLLDDYKPYAEIIPDYSEIGGGSMPDVKLPSFVVAINSDRFDVQWLERELRKNDPPIIARIHKNALLLDARTIQADEIVIVAQGLNEIFGTRMI